MAMTSKRRGLNARLWSLIKLLPGGEETMRDMVAAMHQADGTGKELLGTDEYTSTRRLSERQFKHLLKLVENRARRAKWPKRRRAPEGNVVWFVSEAERKYIRFLSISLGWSKKALTEFVERQTKGKGVRTHKAASALIEPLERMLRERGWTCTETRGQKWWSAPEVREEGTT